ncbi:glycosyltransferase family 39 protein [Patescibacteria group bacterium]|nr:glycosyltransferase family 39 protein [Patescibacteria group bacterium]
MKRLFTTKRNMTVTLTFFVILAMSLALRTYRLNDVPPGVNRDEASIGYTAYSLLQTGRDEYGRFLPLSFESFGDWKLPLYIYLTVPVVKVLGMTDVAVRTVSVLAGVGTVALTFVLVRTMFGSAVLSLLSMAVLALAPWHIHISRVESESNTAVFLVTLGTILFIKGIRKNAPYLFLSFVLWALTYFTYAGNHVFTTLFVLGILVLYVPRIRSSRQAKIGIGAFLVLAAVIFSQTLFGADRTKLTGISIFNSPNVIYRNIDLPRLDYADPRSLPAVLFHNKVLYGLTTAVENYEKAFSAQFLTIMGGTNHAHNIEGFGNMYLVEFPLLFLGLFWLLGKRKNVHAKLLLWWILISPVAASITSDAPHSNRMFAVFPALAVTVALGIWWIMTELIEGKRWRVLAAAALILTYAINVGQYLDQYYNHFPLHEYQYWGVGYRSVADMVNSPEYKTANVIMSHPEQSPYIFMLFYGNYNPALYRKQAVRYPPTPDGFYHVRAFGRYRFRAIDWGQDMKLHNTILVDDYTAIPDAYRGKALHLKQFGVVYLK